MKKPVDQPDRAHLIHRSVLLGDYQLNGTLFKYNQDDAKPNLAIAQLAIRPWLKNVPITELRSF